jgi:hypothetical protein
METVSNTHKCVTNCCYLLAGDRGFTGSVGRTGVAGTGGRTGATGISGDKGRTGGTGSTGFSGQAGRTGATGQTGPRGDSGAFGRDGRTGSVFIVACLTHVIFVWCQSVRCLLGRGEQVF